MLGETPNRRSRPRFCSCRRSEYPHVHLSHSGLRGQSCHPECSEGLSRGLERARSRPDPSLALRMTRGSSDVNKHRESRLVSSRLACCYRAVRPDRHGPSLSALAQLAARRLRCRSPVKLPPSAGDHGSGLTPYFSRRLAKSRALAMAGLTVKSSSRPQRRRTGRGWTIPKHVGGACPANAGGRRLARLSLALHVFASGESDKFAHSATPHF